MLNQKGASRFSVVLVASPELSNMRDEDEDNLNIMRIDGTPYEEPNIDLTHVLEELKIRSMGVSSPLAEHVTNVKRVAHSSPPDLDLTPVPSPPILTDRVVKKIAACPVKVRTVKPVTLENPVFNPENVNTLLMNLKDLGATFKPKKSPSEREELDAFIKPHIRGWHEADFTKGTKARYPTSPSFKRHSITEEEPSPGDTVKSRRAPKRAFSEELPYPYPLTSSASHKRHSITASFSPMISSYRPVAETPMVIRKVCSCPLNLEV